MRNRMLKLGIMVATILPVFSGLARAQENPSGSTKDVQVTITARAAHGSVPRLAREDVIVREQHQPRRVVSLTPLRGPEAPLQLVIFIDSSSTPQIGAQFEDISRFVQKLPGEASVAVAYSMNGSARMEQNFTTDRAAIRKALHLPMGPAAGNTDIYGAVSDLIKKWPAEGNTRREVLLISDGIDVTYGLFNTQPYQNPGLQHAIRDAQRNHVIIFSVFVSSGRITRNRFLNLNGQGSLNELTSRTGGYSFFQGTRTPVSFQPFLNDLRGMLEEQYLLTFEPVPVTSSGLYPLRVITEKSGVKLLAPREVYVAAAK